MGRQSVDGCTFGGTDNSTLQPSGSDMYGVWILNSLVEHGT